MPGFDWNRNGKSDAFDHYMDKKITSSASAKKNRYNRNVKNIDYEKPAHQNQKANRSVIVKSLLAIGLVIGAFALCLSGELGQLGIGLLLIGASIGGYLIMK